MAIALSNLTAGVATSSPASTASIIVDPGECVLVSLVGSQTGNNATGPILSVSGLSLTWTSLVGRIVQTNNRRSAYLFIGVNNSGSQQSGTLTVTGIGDPDPTAVLQEMAWIVDKATGVNASTPITGTPLGVYAGAVSTYTLASVGTPGTGDVVYGMMTSPTSTTAAKYADGFTGLCDFSSTNTRDTKTCYDAADPQDDTPTWTPGGSVGTLVIAAILKIASGSPYPTLSSPELINLTQTQATPRVYVTVP